MNRVLFQYFLLVIFIIRQCLTMKEIRLLDECPLNKNLFDLKTLVPNSTMSYYLMKTTNVHSLFTIKNGYLYTNTLIDMDTLCDKVKECCNKEKENCDFFIDLAGSESFASEVFTKTIQITIHDKNDNYPKFKETNYEIQLSESLKAGYSHPLPIATDNDFGINRVETYEIKRQEPISFDQYFKLNVYKSSKPFKVELKLMKQLDRESIQKYSFELLAIDGSYEDRKTGSININIKVLDENDNLPQFSKQLYKTIVKEGILPLKPILKLTATDPDENINSQILYKLDPNYKNDISITKNFKINEDTGDIFLKQPLDFEKQSSFNFVVLATNPVPQTTFFLTTSYATVEINVENVYDEPLEIKVDYLSKYNYSLIEENQNNVFVAFIFVKSQETDILRSSINCNLDTFTEYLNLNLKSEGNYKSKSYEVRTFTEIDREVLPRIDTKIVCKDSLDSNVPYTTQSINIKIKDQNDNSPSLSIKGDKFVKENTRADTIILTVKAIDKDEGENGRVTFSMDKSNSQSLEYLQIGSTDGIIRIRNSIDCEANFGPLTSLPVVVTASDHGNPPRSTDLQFAIDVIDINDNPPKFTINPMTFSVIEGGPSNLLVGEIEVDDRDVNDDIHIELLKSNQGMLFPFYLFKKSKRIFYLNTTRSLDREKESKFKSYIIAYDGRNEPSHHTITGTIEIDVLDINDNSPVIIFPPPNNASIHIISYQEPKNYKFMTVSANDQDQSKEYNDIEFQLESPIDIFDIDRRDGFIYTRRDMTKADMGEHSFKITVLNTGNPILKSSVIVNVVIDQSAPKSSNSLRSEKGEINEGSNLSTGSYGNSELIIGTCVVTVFFIFFIIIGFVILTLKHCNKEPVCVTDFLNKCFRPNHSSENNAYMPSMKSNLKNEEEFYKDQNQRQLLEKTWPGKEPFDNWNSTKNLETYNTAVISGQYSKYSNSPQYFVNPHTYQTIQEAQMSNKYPELSINNKAMFSLQNRNKYESNHKSEMNLLNSDSYFYDPNHEVKQINDIQRNWMSSLTPMPPRSKSVVNRLISSSEQTENSFAVVYPQEQSTFV